MSKTKAIAISLAFLAVAAYGGDSKAISMVKEGSFLACAGYTIEELVNAYMEKIEWKHIVDKNGFDYVSINGFTAYGKPANIFIQFWVRNYGEIGIQAIKIDGKAQKPGDIANIIMAMCLIPSIEDEDE